MSALDLLQKAAPSPTRAPWCVGSNGNCISVLIENGDVVMAATLIDNAAAHRGLAVAEVCRVKQGNREAAYARLEPKANPT
jgi:hypothetical protein